MRYLKANAGRASCEGVFTQMSEGFLVGSFTPFEDLVNSRVLFPDFDS